MSSSTDITLRKERGIGDVLNVTFRFLRRHIRPLGKSLLLIAGPAFVLASAAGTVAQVGNIMAAGEPTGSSAALLGLGFLLSVFGSIVATVLAVGVVYGYVRCWERGEADAVTVREVWDEARASFWRVVFTTLFVFFLMAAGMFVGIMGIAMSGGIVVAALGGGEAGGVLAGGVMLVGVLLMAAGVLFGITYLSLLFPVRLFEPHDLVNTLKRSSQLLRGRWLNTVGVVVLVGLIHSILGFLFQAPALVLTIFFGATTAQGGGGGIYSVLLVVASVLSGLALTVLFAIPLLALGFQYFSLVEEKEHVGLRARVKALQGTSSSAPQSPPAEGQGNELAPESDRPGPGGSASSATPTGEPDPEAEDDADRWKPDAPDRSSNE